jgi:hypothetical protein
VFLCTAKWKIRRDKQLGSTLSSRLNPIQISNLRDDWSVLAKDLVTINWWNILIQYDPALCSNSWHLQNLGQYFKMYRQVETEYIGIVSLDFQLFKKQTHCKRNLTVHKHDLLSKIIISIEYELPKQNEWKLSKSVRLKRAIAWLHLEAWSFYSFDLANLRWVSKWLRWH